MKNYKFLFLLCFSFIILQSCSNDKDDPNTDPVTEIPGNNLGTGQSAKDLLTNKTFSKLKLELAFPDNFAPTQASINNLVDFIKARTYKTEVEVVAHGVSINEKKPYSIKEIRKIEKENREDFNTKNTIAVFIFFADGNSEENSDDSSILGTAYQNTSIVIFEKTIQDLTENVPPNVRSGVESTSLNHEFGHLLGLVANGTPAQSDHVDPDNEAHCTTENCLMRAEAKFSVGIMGMLNNGVPKLGPNCLEDLKANGGR